MKHITISFDVSDNYSIRHLLNELAISLTLKMLNANTVTITKLPEEKTTVYDLEQYRQELKRFTGYTKGDKI